MDIKELIKELIKAAITGLCIMGVLGGGIAGCTYVVAEGNRQYYETMQQCIAGGGTFVPTKGNSSEAACIAALISG